MNIFDALSADFILLKAFVDNIWKMRIPNDMMIR